jgi:lipid A 4'-phosphatase
MSGGVSIRLSGLTLWLWAALLAASLLFYHFPEIDLFFARLLYLGDGKFLLDGTAFGQFLHGPLDRAMKWGLIVSFVAYLLICALKVKLPESLHKKLIFLYSSVLISVVGIINLGLKEFWGRARPNDLAEFGGKAEFSPAWAMVRQCAENCSFTSGHAGMGASLALLAVFVPPQWRKYYLIFSLLFAAMVAFGRMGRGAHFLSDVVISCLIVWAVALLARDILKLTAD